ncbi:MAG: hypothetical protein R3C08_08305 [Hyphomonas sp.]
MGDEGRANRYANKPADQSDAASLSVAALPPIQFDLIRSRLKPNDPAKSASEFRDNSIERTLSILESSRSSIGGGVSANLPGVTKAKSSSTTTTSTTTDNVTSSTGISASESKRSVESGERPDASASAPDMGSNAWNLSNFSSELDLQLAIDAANYIYTNAKLTDTYYDLDLSQDNYEAWVVQLKVNVQPYVRDMPYDVRANLTFSATGNDIARKVRLVPLFATGNYEASNYTNSLAKLAQVYANITAIAGGTGLGASFERRLEKLMEQSGVDINTRISVGVHNQNQVRLSLPAAFSPRSGYEAREQDYTITLLAYVEETCSGADKADQTLTISTEWGMIDADTGRYLNYRKVDSSGNPLPLLPGYERVDVPLLPIESILPPQQTVVYVDDGTSSTKLDIPGAEYLPNDEFDAYLVRDKNAASTLANGAAVCIGANNFLYPGAVVNDGTSTNDVDDILAANDVVLKDRVLSVTFPSLIALQKESPNWYLRLETTQVCGSTFMMKCYPIAKNTTKSGRPAEPKPSFKAGVLSESVLASASNDQKEKRAAITAYVQSVKGVSPASQYFRVLLKNGTILPANGVKSIHGSVEARSQQDVIDNGFVAKIDSSFEIVARDIQGDKIQLIVFPWDNDKNEPVSMDAKQELNIKVEN